MHMLKKGDILLIAGIIAAVIAGMLLFRLYYSGSGDLTAVIRQNGKVIRTVDLETVTKPERFKVTGAYEDVILIEKGRIRFEDADCPDKVCVKTGWLDQSGDTAACLPNRTVIEIKAKKAKVDGVAY